MPKKPKAPDPDRLVRDQPGVYLSEDGRFTVRSDAAGAWYVGDGERTNELGLDLVFGPLATLAEAKEAVRHQRETPTGQTADEAAALAAKAPPIPERKGVGGATQSKSEPEAKQSEKADSGPVPKAERSGKRTATARPEPSATPELGPARPVSPKAKVKPEPKPEPEPEPEPEAPKPTVYRARRRPTGDARDEIVEVLHRIDDAWLESRADDMADDLDEGVAFVEEGFRSRVEGRDRAIRYDRDFLSSATILEFSESDLLVNVWGDTAVATFRYELAWEADGKRRQARGHDLFVFRRTGAKWLAVLRLDSEDTPASSA